MSEIKNAKCLVETIQEGVRFNLIQAITDKEETIQVSDWGKLPLVTKTNYFFEIKENNGHLNLQSATAENGTQIVNDAKNKVSSIKKIVQSLSAELNGLEEVV